VKNGAAVAQFERAFADYVGARYGIALCNGTATIHTALAVIGVDVADVAVPPLTMAATTIAVLHAGGRPVFQDVDPATWLMRPPKERAAAYVPVSLYGIHYPDAPADRAGVTVDDAAQTLRPHGNALFTSYSLQASKILPLGEGGVLVTDDEGAAQEARSFSSLGYRMRADQPRIDPAVLKSPTYERHHTLGWNYRMSDIVAREGVAAVLEREHLTGALWVDVWKRARLECADLYRQVVASCEWLTPQYVPTGWTHDYWAYAVAVDTPERAIALADRVVEHGGERPYAAWRLTYHEPAFRHLAPIGGCPVAEDLQPRLLQLQTNDLRSAERNAEALRLAIEDLG